MDDRAAALPVAGNLVGVGDVTRIEQEGWSPVHDDLLEGDFTATKVAVAGRTASGDHHPDRRHPPRQRTPTSPHSNRVLDSGSGPLSRRKTTNHLVNQAYSSPLRRFDFSTRLGFDISERVFKQPNC